MRPRLDHAVVAVRDFERSNRFYADVLGVAPEEAEGSLIELISYD